eukprot:TRINITY_DN8349_c0_g1_i1.p1 TRINITY_DN8349_c0_g1~~TRINITY_DN8349_c0_g1_i1.p1  ORF type:complete len:352 (-),score=35.31 TRINITY_DN8349_c0_g1_i1:178-1233(-)
MATFDGLRMQVASDLHLEFYDELPAFRRILVPRAPVLALLGDICALGHPRGVNLYEEFLDECKRHFELVILVIGNHEYYSNSHEQRAVSDIVIYLRQFCAESHGQIVLLENECITIQGVKLAGTALWSLVPEEQTMDGARRAGRDPMSTVEACMNDYHVMYVNDGNEAAASSSFSDHDQSGLCQHHNKDSFSSRSNCRVVRVQDSNKWHNVAVEFLEREAADATENRINLVVLTHHTPTFRGTSDPRHGSNPQGMSSAFSSNLEYMMMRPSFAAIHTWCFGHTHYNSDQMLAGVRLLSNQLGYPSKFSRGYRPGLVIEVPRVYAGRNSATISQDQKLLTGESTAGGACSMA